jgi:hypothetical protein
MLWHDVDLDSSQDALVLPALGNAKGKWTAALVQRVCEDAMKHVMQKTQKTDQIAKTKVAVALPTGAEFPQGNICVEVAAGPNAGSCYPVNVNLVSNLPGETCAGRSGGLNPYGR